MNNTPPEVLEKWRKEFESWAHGDGYCVDKVIATGRYVHAYTAIAWKVWQAARQTAVIELSKPATKTDHFDDPVKYWRKSTVVQAIEPQGYRVEVNGES